MKKDLDGALNEADKKIENLELKLERVPDSFQTQIDEAIVAIKKERQKIAQQSIELKYKSESLLEDLKDEIADIIDETKTAIDDLSEDMQQFMAKK